MRVCSAFCIDKNYNKVPPGALFFLSERGIGKLPKFKKGIGDTPTSYLYYIVIQIGSLLKDRSVFFNPEVNKQESAPVTEKNSFIIPETS